jgi:hypothetical protein
MNGEKKQALRQFGRSLCSEIYEQTCRAVKAEHGSAILSPEIQATAQRMDQYWEKLDNLLDADEGHSWPDQKPVQLGFYLLYYRDGRWSVSERRHSEEGDYWDISNADLRRLVYWQELPDVPKACR